MGPFFVAYIAATALGRAGPILRGRLITDILGAESSPETQWESPYNQP